MNSIVELNYEELLEVNGGEDCPKCKNAGRNVGRIIREVIIDWLGDLFS